MEKQEYLSALNIEKASKEVPINERNLFIDFMLKRFHSTKNYTDLSYSLQWANRINKRNTSCMDKESLEIYLSLANEKDINEETSKYLKT